MEKQQYLDYFINNKKKPTSSHIYHLNHHSNVSKSQHINHSKVDKKLLPHISQQYQYKITNQLLVHKIMNPKRDKLITQNFHKIPSRPGTRQRKTRQPTANNTQIHIKSLDVGRRQNAQPSPGSISLYTRIRLKQSLSKYKQKGMKSYEKQFNLALQNQRMGRRIINTKSSVQQILKKTFYTYKSNNKSKQEDKQNYQPDLKSSFIRGRQNNKIYFSGKINNGVKVFFNPIRNDQKSLSRSKSLNQSKISKSSIQRKEQQDDLQQNNDQQKIRQTKTSYNNRSKLIKNQENQTQQSRHIETHFPQSFKIFGKGPTILMIYDVEIICNPPLKQDSILILELITHERRISVKRNKERSIRTTPFSYQFIKPSQNSMALNCIRFAINVSQIGDFVPLRIYRVHGVQIQQLGIIDVDLAAFRYRKSQLIQNDCQQNQTLTKEYKLSRSGYKMQRDIISGKIKSKLRKNLLNKPVQIFVNMKYKIYPKRYKMCQKPKLIQKNYN